MTATRLRTMKLDRRMKTEPIVPARIDWSDAAAPFAPDFDDVYHPRDGALAQARHVFLGGNGLPQRWRGRERFVVLETGFGLGNNFLATWAAWRDDAAALRAAVLRLDRQASADAPTTWRARTPHSPPPRAGAAS